jgi:hypothetical protein
MNEISRRGATFCHVDKIKHDSHEIDDITGGNQKWNGAMPSFRRIDEKRRMYMFLGIENLYHIMILLIRRILEPSP